jgi:hypothetical protein
MRPEGAVVHAGRATAGRLLFLGALLLYVGSSRGTITAIDLQIRYETSRQIWRHATIDPTPEQAAANPDCYPRNDEGEHYSIYGIGQSITMLPAVAIADLTAAVVAPARRDELGYLGGQLIFETVIAPLIAALGVWCLYRLGLRIGLSPALAVGTAIAFGFGSYWWFYAKTTFHNLELTTATLGGVLFLAGHEGRHGRLALGSALLGWTFQYRQEALVLVAPLWAIGLGSLRRRGEFDAKHIAAWTLPIVLSGLGALLHNHLRTGSLLGNPYLPSKCGWQLWTDLPLGNAFAITFGAAKGVFWYSPILLLGLLLLLPIGPGRLRASRDERAFAVPALLYFAFVASQDRSSDDWGWGPRFLLPVLPFLVLGLASIVRERFESPRIARISVMALALSVCLQAALSFDTHETEVLQTIRAHGQEGIAHAIPHPGIDHPLDSPLAGRLRNLGVPLPGAPGALLAWSDPRIQELGRPLEGNLWWLKLASMPEGAPLRGLLLLIGPLLLVAGLLTLVAAVLAGRGAVSPVASALSAGDRRPGREGSTATRAPPPVVAATQGASACADKRDGAHPHSCATPGEGTA